MKDTELGSDLDRVADAFGISREMLTSRARPDNVVYARFALCQILASRFLTASDIAMVIGRDRCTIYHAVRRHRELMEVCEYYRTRFALASGSVVVSKIEWVFTGPPKTDGVYLVACVEHVSAATALWDGHKWHSVYPVFAWATLPARPAPAAPAKNNKTER